MRIETWLLFIALILFSLAIFQEFRELEWSIKKLSMKIDYLNKALKEIDRR